MGREEGFFPVGGRNPNEKKQQSLLNMEILRNTQPFYDHTRCISCFNLTVYPSVVFVIVSYSCILLIFFVRLSLSRLLMTFELNSLITEFGLSSSLVNFFGTTSFYLSEIRHLSVLYAILKQFLLLLFCFQ